MEQYRIIKALSGFYYVQTEDGVVECRARGRFRMEFHAETTGGPRVVATVGARRDPGYGGTAEMISQGALALAAGEALSAGVTTPAVAFGLPYAQRLRGQGFTLDASVA